MSPMFCLLSPYGARHAAEHVLRHVSGYLGVLLEAPARVLEPLLTERHVDPELVPGPDQYPPELLVHAEEHLELVAVLRDFELVDEPEGVPDQELVVGRDPDVSTALQELVEEEYVILPDGVEVLVGDLARLVVDALAQAHRDPGLDEAADVLQAAPHVGLDHGPHVLVPAAQIDDHLQRDAGIRRVLHVHPDEAAPGSRILDDLLQVRPAQLLAQREPEAGELHRDPRAEVMFVQRVYHLFVVAELSGGVGLALGALPEQVYGGDAALLVQ